jgi:iron-sulfur cluster insertion protein
MESDVQSATSGSPSGAAGAPRVTVTDSAARRLAEIVTAEGDDRLVLRIAVSGGGCSGFQYGFTLDDAVHDDDAVIERGGVKVVIDNVSLDLLAGAEIDFVEELSGAAFRIRNPNATSSCGCGNSFAI